MKKPAKPAAPELTAHDRLMRDRAKLVADKYMPDPTAKVGSGPWAAWAVERIEQIEGELARARRSGPPRAGKSVV